MAWNQTIAEIPLARTTRALRSDLEKYKIDDEEGDNVQRGSGNQNIKNGTPGKPPRARLALISIGRFLASSERSLVSTL